MDDPSGYLAQQTALLNSTISRQTGDSNSSQLSSIMSADNKLSQGGTNYLPKPKPSSLASPTSLYNKNNPSSPVFVHSSMTPTPAGSVRESEDGSPSMNQRCEASADTQSLSSLNCAQQSEVWVKIYKN